MSGDLKRLHSSPRSTSRVKKTRLDGKERRTAESNFTSAKTMQKTLSLSPGFTLNASVNLSKKDSNDSPRNSQADRATFVSKMESVPEEFCKKVDHRSVNVAVRVRPFTNQELMLTDNRQIVSVCDNSIILNMEPSNGDSSLCETKFEFDHCLWSFSRDDDVPYASQEMVYETLGSPILDKVLEGYNACLFAYGMTSSGKSYCIIGNKNDEGLIPRLSADIFERIQHSASSSFGEKSYGVKIEISFYEIYNERIRDLFASSHDKSVKRQELRIREHPERGPYVEGLASFAVRSHLDVSSWISLAIKRRATASTTLNEHSSRSHAVFLFSIYKSMEDRYVTSKLNVVDLAGCERHTSSDGNSTRLKEGAAINRSLLTLGRVISMLAEHGPNSALLYKEKKIHIPYRDSVLTWLLKESLGGNSQTTMLTTISPSSSVIEETLSTLRYAAKARRVVNCAQIAEDPKSRIIRELRSEIARLLAQQSELHAHSSQLNIEKELALLKDALIEREEEMEMMKRNWLAELHSADRLRREELSKLENDGLMTATVSSSSQTNESESKSTPCLVNLHSDPLLNDTLVYPVRDGETMIGSKSASENNSAICLGGPLISEQHCLIKYINGSLRIEPLEFNAGTYVNGQWIERETIVYDDDRLVFGDHYFRVQLPTNTDVNTDNSCYFDFQRARTELLRGQELRGQWLLMKQKADLEIGKLNDLLRVRDERIKRMEEELELARNGKKQAESQITQKQETHMKTEETGCNCSIFSDGTTDGYEELTLWTKITEANQICKKIGVNAHFFMRPSFDCPIEIRVSLDDMALSFVWSIEVFTEILNELREAWDMDVDAPTVRKLLLDAEPCSSQENMVPPSGNNSMNISYPDSFQASPLFPEEKENDPEILTKFIHVAQNSVLDGIKEITNICNDHEGAITSISHLKKLQTEIQHLNSDNLANLDCNNLRICLLKVLFHLLVSMGALVPFIRDEPQLKVEFQKLGNSIEVLCTNLRYHVRNLRSFIVEEKTDSRVLDVLQILEEIANRSTPANASAVSQLMKNAFHILGKGVRRY